MANRHGQGYHNVAKDVYGDNAWDCYWSMQYGSPFLPSFLLFLILLVGDSNFTWGPDPSLTERGLGEAAIAAKAWPRELALGAPLPQSWYSSPLSRSASTMDIVSTCCSERTILMWVLDMERVDFLRIENHDQRALEGDYWLACALSSQYRKGEADINE